MSKVAIVTGAGQGIGFAIAKRLVQDGFKVGVLDYNAETAEKVFAYIRKDGDRRFLVVANLSNQNQEFVVEESIKSILIENTSVEEVLTTQTLEPWDAFCIELAK